MLAIGCYGPANADHHAQSRNTCSPVKRDSINFSPQSVQSRPEHRIRGQAKPATSLPHRGAAGHTPQLFRWENPRPQHRTQVAAVPLVTNLTSP
jgi:hypothetical protein